MLASVVRARPKLPVTAEPVTDTRRAVKCHATATTDEDLKGITIYVHAFDYTFEKGGEYTICFDSTLMPRKIVLNNLRSSGKAAQAYVPLRVPHAFVETIGSCFIEKNK